MCANKIIITMSLAIMTVSIEAGVLAHSHAVPALAPAIGYHHAIPYNVPPYADRTDLFSKALNVPVVSYAAPPLVHSAPHPVAYAPALAPAVPAPYPAYAPAVPHFASAHLAPTYPAYVPSPYSPVPALPAPLAAPIWRR